MEQQKIEENKELTGKERSLANLEQGMWKPGQSGNEAGRPKGSQDGLAARLRRIGGKEPREQHKKLLRQVGIEMEIGDNFEAVSYMVWEQAYNGEKWAIEEIRRACEEAEQGKNPVSAGGNITLIVNAVAGVVKDG